MGLVELFLLAVGLSMDAFAVSVCKGLAVGKTQPKHMLLCGLWFGGAQAVMPLLGYLLGRAFEVYITEFDHWVAFLLLCAIGISMVWEAFHPDKEQSNASFAFRVMFVMAVATSIDALAVGITLGLLPSVNLPLALGIIGGVTFVTSAVGVKIGSAFGTRYRFGAELFGGILLVLLGLKILLEHLGVLNF